MNVVYYKYFVHKGKSRYQFNLLPILKNFCKVKSETFRRTFHSPGGDNLFLFHINSCTFLFVITKDQEVIKTISGNTMSHDDIYDKLGKDESLGFASYIFVGNNYYGIASTFFGPKNSYWTHFLNILFEKLNIDTHIFDSEPFPVETTKKEALKFSFKGQTTIRMNNTHPYFGRLLGQFGIDNNEAKTLNIEIKPEPRKEMAKSFDAITTDIPLDGIDTFVVRGKEFIEDNMTDYYIVGSGHICDKITADKDGNVCKSLEEKATRNRKLREAVNEFKEDKSYSNNDLQGLSTYNNFDNWPDNL